VRRHRVDLAGGDPSGDCVEVVGDDGEPAREGGELVWGEELEGVREATLALVCDVSPTIGEPDDGAPAVARVRRPFGDALPFEAVHEGGRRAAGQLQVSCQVGLTALAVQGEARDGLALGGPEPDGVRHGLPVVLGRQDEPAEVADGFVERVDSDAGSCSRDAPGDVGRTTVW